VIVLIGMPGAGKEEFIKIARKNGYRIVRMGDVVRDYAIQKGIDAQKIGVFADAERKKNSQSVWAYRTIARVRTSKTVIDGCRSLAELEVFKSNFNKVITVAIFAPPEIRYKRLTARGRKDAPTSIEEFMKRDRLELKWGVGNASVLADFMIVNDGKLKNYQTQINNFFKKILKK
jgi:dephospho-CoA kinase